MSSGSHTTSTRTSMPSAGASNAQRYGLGARHVARVSSFPAPSKQLTLVVTHPAVIRVGATAGWRRTRSETLVESLVESLLFAVVKDRNVCAWVCLHCVLNADAKSSRGPQAARRSGQGERKMSAYTIKIRIKPARRHRGHARGRGPRAPRYIILLCAVIVSGWAGTVRLWLLD